MDPTIAFLFSGMQASAAAEAAARRRIRSLQAAHGSVTAWEVRTRGPEDGSQSYTAEVQARLAGGEMLRAQDQGTDVLAALRLAFNAMERLLESDQERARTRAARWLAAVRDRRAASSMQFH
jgi:ribosome-associated translation inhibitor RaiA